nr:hypothetical protein [Tanacetum cinerariifolium]
MFFSDPYFAATHFRGVALRVEQSWWSSRAGEHRWWSGGAAVVKRWSSDSGAVEERWMSSGGVAVVIDR